MLSYGGCETQVACDGLFMAHVKNALCQVRSTCVGTSAAPKASSAVNQWGVPCACPKGTGELQQHCAPATWCLWSGKVHRLEL